MLLLYFVSQGIEFAAMESFDETGPCHRLPFPCQPLLQNLPCDSMRLSKTVVFNGVNQNAFVILEQESPEFFVVSSDILDHFNIEYLWKRRFLCLGGWCIEPQQVVVAGWSLTLFCEGADEEPLGVEE